MPVESVYQRLEPLLPRVRKPIAYVGGEVNSLVKDWDATDVRWALLYPDAYEVGLPNQGVQILYEILNEQDGVLAERTYSVWPDLEALMREHGLPQFTVDAHRPVGAFDVLGVSFSTELGLHEPAHGAGPGRDSAAERRPGPADGTWYPLVIAGGHAAFNPEPIADFLDGAVLGDGEQAVLAITAKVRDWKRDGRPGGRDGLLATLAADCQRVRPALLRRGLPPGRADSPGRAQPARYPAGRRQAHRDGPGQLAVPEQADGSGRRDRARAVQRGDLPRLHPGLPVLPGRDDHPAGAGAVHHHDRRHGGDGLAASGFAEVGLLSLSSADHSEINDIATAWPTPYEGTNTGLSLPSTRVDAFNVTLADELSRNGRRSGLTFAPGGRHRPDAQGDQQDGHRGRPDPGPSPPPTPAAGGR